MTFAELTPSQLALLAGIGLFVFVILRRTARTLKSSPAPSSRFSRDDESPRSAAATMLPLGSARVRSVGGAAEQEAWEVEMHELARELRSQIDTKMRALEALVRTADEAIGRLEVVIDHAESLGLIDERETVGAGASTWDSSIAARDASATFASTAQSVSRPARPRPLRMGDEAALRARLRAGRCRPVGGQDRHANRVASRRSRTDPQPPRRKLTRFKPRVLSSYPLIPFGASFSQSAITSSPPFTGAWQAKFSQT